MSRIGFIGLGNMGLPMAQNLLKAGHSVRGFDVSKAQVDALVASGGEPAANVKAAASGADVVITMLPAGAHVREWIRWARPSCTPAAPVTARQRKSATT
jgi:3-hydroxyisobutyrate dehydrogenase